MATTVVETFRSPHTVQPLRAVVKAEDSTWAEIVEAGLSALGETPGSLFGHGIRGVLYAPDSQVLMTGTYTVYGHRD